MSLSKAKDKLKSLGWRSDKCGVYSPEFGWRTWEEDPEALLDKHLQGELLLGPRYGGRDKHATRLMAVDVDGDSHGKGDAYTAAQAVATIGMQAGLPQPLTAVSKSSTGYHCYWLFEAPALLPIAAAVAKRLVLKTKEAGFPEADKPYPVLGGSGTVLALFWCGLLDPGAASDLVNFDGSMLLDDPWSPEVAEDQIGTFLRYPPTTLEQLAGAYTELGCDLPSADETIGPRVEGGGYAKAALRRAAERIASCAEGGRNTLLTEEAWNMGRFVDELGTAEVHSTLVNAALACGLSREEAEYVVFRQVETGRRMAT